MQIQNSQSITLNNWQLISCSFYFAPGIPVFLITLSVGDSKILAVAKAFEGLAPTKLQIGDFTASFIGDISSVRILSPGPGYLTDSNFSCF